MTKMCTHCLKEHDASACPDNRREVAMRSQRAGLYMPDTRPRPSTAVAAVIAAALLTSGCGINPEIPPPPSVLMQEPAALPDIPACEGQLPCRHAYYAQSRSVCVDTRQSYRGLQDWARTVTTKP